MKRGMVVLAAMLLVGAALAQPVGSTYGPVGAMTALQRDTLGNPYDGVQTYGSAAQDFETAYDAYDIWVVSDFTTSVAYYLDAVTAQGFCSVATNGTGANFAIYNGLPWDGGSVVLSASGYDDLYSNGEIGADFFGAELAAGSYYMVFQAVREYTTAGQSYIYQTSTGNNNDYQWNPGEGFGFGISTPILDQNENPIDVNWQLSATPVPEPASLLLIGLCLALRRR